MVRSLSLSLRRTLPFAGLACALIYGWIVAGTRPFTMAATILTAIPAVVVLAFALARPGTRQPFRAWRAAARDAYARSMRARARPRAAAGAAAWALVIGLVAVWELFNLLRLPRADHPTISSLIDTLTESRPGRFLLFLLWLGLGVEVLRR
jgi:hypothetical protein